MVFAKKLALVALAVASVLSAPFSQASVPVAAVSSYGKVNLDHMVCFWEGNRSRCIWVE
jgi:hypothetical protein